MTDHDKGCIRAAITYLNATVLLPFGGIEKLKLVTDAAERAINLENEIESLNKSLCEQKALIIRQDQQLATMAKNLIQAEETAALAKKRVEEIKDYYKHMDKACQEMESLTKERDDLRDALESSRSYARRMDDKLAIEVKLSGDAHDSIVQLKRERDDIKADRDIHLEAYGKLLEAIAAAGGSIVVEDGKVRVTNETAARMTEVAAKNRDKLVRITKVLFPPTESFYSKVVHEEAMPPAAEKETCRPKPDISDLVPRPVALDKPYRETLVEMIKWYLRDIKPLRTDKG